jgi:hypothetical protein
MNTHYPGSENEPKTDQKRIAALEAENRALKARLDKLEKALNDKVQAVALVTDAAYRAANEATVTFELSRAAMDERVRELAQKMEAASDAELRPLMIEYFGLIADRFEPIEKLLGPALQGRVKLMAQQV